MKAANWVQDAFRALPRYLLVLTAVSALALLARAAVPSSARPSLRASVPTPAATPTAIPTVIPAAIAGSRAVATRPLAAGATASGLLAQARLPEPVRPQSRSPQHSYYRPEAPAAVAN